MMTSGRPLAAAFVCILSGLLHAQDDRATLARRLLAGGDAQRAIPEFVQALETSPSNALLWTELGEARLATGQAKSASGDFGRAVKLDPSSVRAQKGLAGAVEASGNNQRALIEWRRLSQITEGPDRALADSRVDALLTKLGMGVPSESKPVGKPALVGGAAAKPHAQAKPSPTPKSAAKAAPKAGADLQKALELWKSGKRDLALEGIRTIVRSNPTPDAWYWGGVMRIEEKAWDKADINLKKAAEDPKLAGRAWYWLGRSAEGQGKKSAAKEAFQKSLQKDPSGEFAADIKSRLETPANSTSASETQDHETSPAAPVVHEIAPPLVADSLRELWTWNPPDIAIPPFDASPAGKLLGDASRQLKAGQTDLALSSIESLKMKYPGTSASDASTLATAIVNLAMGLHPLAATNAQAFLRDLPDHSRAPLAKFVLSIALLRQGRPDTATSLLASFKPKPDDGWSEAEHQSAIAQGLRLQKRYSEAASALRLAFQAEKDTRKKRSLALRSVRDNQSAGTPAQALSLVVDARKGCDKGGACMHLAVAEGDLQMHAKLPSKALPAYSQVTRDWPSSPEAPWALYQIGTAHFELGKAQEAAKAWQELIEKHPGSYWASQAKLRMEDALWRIKYKETLK